MDSLAAAVIAGASPDVLGRLPLPEEYVAAHVRASDVDIFRDAAEADKDVRKTLRVGSVAIPELAPDEVVIAVFASSINYNTVWSAIFEPVPTFTFLRRYGKQDRWSARHDLPYHVLGSDAAGVIVRTGASVRHWTIGDRVVVVGAHVDDQEPATYADGMLGRQQRAWGYETNFGGLAHFAVVRANQLLPKPAHLTWEEAAGNLVCAATAYRMLVGDRGARIKQGDIVLIWGAAGGLGSYAVQLVRNGGGIAVGVVGSERKERALHRIGCDAVINRVEIGLGGTVPDDVVGAGKRLGRAIRGAVGEDPHVVFEHVGRATFPLSVYVVRRGGTVVTCGSSTGYIHQFDNRYLWMNLKRVVGSHIANLQEQWEVNRLISLGRIAPMLSALYPMSEVGEAARLVQTNGHVGKVGVLCLAPEAGLGVTDAALRDRIGAGRVAPLMNHRGR